MMGAVPAKADPAKPVHEIAHEAWPYMTPSQRQVVDMMAADLYRNGTSPEQKVRISGSQNGKYDRLPDWRKAPFRGAAIKALGQEKTNFKRGAI